MKKILLPILCAVSTALLTSCTTITVDAPQPAELSLGRNSRVSIVPEAGSDCGELAHSLFQLLPVRATTNSSIEPTLAMR